MIHRISQSAADLLVSKNIIEKDEADIYVYGCETLFSGIIDFIITLAMGLLFHRVLAAVIYFVMFVSVRMYTGGYHADSYLKCKALFVCITASVLAASYIKLPLGGEIMILLLFLLVVCNMCPVENPNKPLTVDQKRKYRLIGVLYSVIWSAAAVITYFNITYISTIISCNAFAITIMLIVGAYRKENPRDEKEFYS